MKTKIIKVLDDATEMWFMIGKPEASDSKMLEETGWGSQPVTLLVNFRRAGGVEGCMSTFEGYIPYDLKVRGPLSVSGTTTKLARIIRYLPLEEIPDVLDVRIF